MDTFYDFPEYGNGKGEILTFVNERQYVGLQIPEPTITEQKNYKKLPRNLLLLFLLLIFAVVVAYKFFDNNGEVKTFSQKKVDFIEYNEAGKPELSPERIAKRDREIRKIERREYKDWEEPCEQYALKARRAGYFPILGYSDKIIDSVFLNVNNTWKFGKTCITEEVRYYDKVYYSNSKAGIILTDMDLNYVIQKKGTEMEMLIEERLKIYSYAILSENLTREKPLIRPPGNKRDD